MEEGQRLEVVDQNVDTHVLVGVVARLAGALLEHHRPLGQFEQPVAHAGHAEVRVVFAEGVYRFFCEYRLDKIEAVAQLHHWDHLVEVKIQGFLELGREVLIKVAARAQKDGRELLKALFFEGPLF